MGRASATVRPRRPGLADACGDILLVGIEIVPQPYRVPRGRATDFADQLIQRNPADSGDFGRVWAESRRCRTEVDMHDLVFGEAVAYLRPIVGAKAELERRDRAKFLAQPPLRGAGRAFAGPGMAAAGIRPKAARVIFGEGALLEQHATLCIDEEDGKRAVPQAAFVHDALASFADAAIARVDEDERLVFRGERAGERQEGRRGWRSDA